MEYDHSTYISPFTWRYGSDEMKRIFSEEHKRELLRRVWIALARAEMKYGLVKEEQLDELISHKDDIDIERASEIESEIHHDLMAEIKTYAEQCPTAGGIIHLGATSMDALDNADALRFREALILIKDELDSLIKALMERAGEEKATVTMAFTHIQPAEITTIGYRLSQTLQDLLDDREDLVNMIKRIKGKGMKGAVGTGASYYTLTDGKSMELERLVMEDLSLEAFDASTQIYSRKQDLRMMEILSNIACTLHKFSQDFRVLQSPPLGEFSEPFSSKQVGSSAMPFKRNPILSEKICSLSRCVSESYFAAWNNASSTFLERSLDDSASRRVFIPGSFLALSEMLITETKIISGMKIHSTATKKLLESYSLFSSTEKLLMELGKRGADRQKMHEVIREESLKAWEVVMNGRTNPLGDYLKTNENILQYMTPLEIESSLDASGYTGDAVKRTEMVLARAEKALDS